MKIDIPVYEDLILRDAILQYGDEKQMDMVVEECAELINAVMKFRRGRCEVKDITTEMADVIIMIEQLVRILSVNEGELETEIDNKLQRLQRRLRGATE